MRPILRWNVPMRGGCAQTHAVPRIQMGANTFPQRFCPTSLAPCLSPLGRKPLKTTSATGLTPKNQLSTNSPHTQSFVQCHNRVFEVLFPQFQSLLTSSQNVVFAFWVTNFLPCLWLPSFSRRLSFFFDFHLASLLPLPYSFLCSARTIPPSLCLQYLCRSPCRKHANQHQPEEVGPHLSSAM